MQSKTNRGDGAAGGPCQDGQPRAPVSVAPACNSPRRVRSETPLSTASNSAAIINDGAECICFKALAAGRAWGQMVFPSKHCGGASHTSSARRPNRCRRRRRRGEAEVNIIIQLCESRAGGRSSEESRSPSPGAWIRTHTNTPDGTITLDSVKSMLPSSAAVLLIVLYPSFCVDGCPGRVAAFLRPALKGKVLFNLRKLSGFSEEKSPARHICSGFVCTFHLV